MKFLVTNDDGIYSPGLHTMAKSLVCAGHEILMVAPDRERSGCGHAMTLDRPLRIKKVPDMFLNDNFSAYSCDGTPTDCVILALDVLEYNPDMVLSGINRGPNLGDDITYSGTVCGAMEGLIAGFPSIAVSLASTRGDKLLHNETAGGVLMLLLDWIKQNPMPSGVLYNVNVPNVPLQELAGISLTRKGVRRYHDKITKAKTPSGHEVYWIGGRIEDEVVEGTDVWAIKQKMASVTPIHMEMTCFDTYGECADAGMADALEKQLKESGFACGA